MKKIVWSLLSLLSILSLLYCHYRHYCHISRYVGGQVLGRFKLPFDTFFAKVSDGRTDGPTETKTFRAALGSKKLHYVYIYIYILVFLSVWRYYLHTSRKSLVPRTCYFSQIFLFKLQQNRFYQVCHVFELTKCILAALGSPRSLVVGQLVGWSVGRTPL